MAFSDLGSLGATGATTNNQGTLDLTTAAAIAVDDFVVVVVAADNIANGGDDNACSGVTLGVGGQALTKAKQTANALAAQAGASSSIWYGKATSILASGGTIRATFGSGTLVDASGLTARKFSMAAGMTGAIEGTPGENRQNTAADPPSLNVTTANIACLRIRSIATQVGNNTNLTPTASWTAWANGNSATTGTTAEITARAEHIISTATGAASDPTYVSAINASCYVAFKEELPQITGTLAETEDADAAAMAGEVTGEGPPPGGGPPVLIGTIFTTLDSTTANTGTCSGTLTVPADAEAVVVSFHGQQPTAGYLSSGVVTFTKGGSQVAMTPMPNASQGDSNTSAYGGVIWGLLAPDQGSTTSIITWDWVGTASLADATRKWTVSFFKNVDPTTLFRDGGAVQTTSSSPPGSTGTLTAQTDDLIYVIAWGYADGAEGSVNTWSNCTLQEQITVGVANMDIATAVALPTGNQSVGATAVTSFAFGGLSAAVIIGAPGVAAAKSNPVFASPARYWRRR